MLNKVLMGTLLGLLAVTAGAQTPTQDMGSLQAGAAVTPKDPIAPTKSISVEGLSPSSAGPLNSTAPDSGPQPWKDVMGWISLKEGMSPDEVRALLGTDYRESSNPKGLIWTYQDQKALLFGSVTFRDGQLEAWTSPRF